MSSLETLEGQWRTRPGGLVFAAYAEALGTAGRREEAIQVLLDGIARWPRNLPGRLVLGNVARDGGDFETARASFQAAVEIDGNCRAGLRGLADVCMRQQYLKQAFENWNRLAILDPDDAEAAEAARRMASSMDSKGSMGAFVDVREQEDDRSREALTEGATSQAMFAATSQATMATLPDFDLNLPDFASPSSLTATAGFSAPTLPDLPGFQAPEIPAAAPEPVPAAPSSSPSLAKFEESAFATLEMPSFPGKTIPPPPLELPKVPVQDPMQQPTASGLFTAGASPNPFAISEERLQLAEATQMMPAPPRASAPVTGDDIEDRLDEVFGASSLPMPPSMPPLSTSQDASSIPSTPLSAAPESSTKVTGNDVEDRLGELFGETGEMSLASLKTEPAVVKPASPVVSGDDVEGRLDDLFGESVIDLTSSHPQGRDSEVADTSALARDAVFAQSAAPKADDTSAFARSGDTTIESRLPSGMPGAESTTELHTSSLRLNPEQMVDLAARGSELDQTGSTIDLPTAEFNAASETRMSPRLTAEDVDSRLDELFASSEFLADPVTASRRTGFVAKAPAAEPGVVTGNDIEGRLDDLFGGDSDFPVSLPTVTFAEEYLRQGHKDKAVSIYRQLLDRDPANEEIRRRLDEIEGRR